MRDPRPISFGFSIFPYSRFRHVEEIAEVVLTADELGYYAVLLPEHLLPPRWPGADLATKYWFDLPTMAAYLAAVTKHIRFLTSVLVLPYHHPVALAKALATLDVISGGRVLCGVGTGWMQAEFRRLGLPFQERGAITDEYVLAMKELWTSESPAFSGKYISFEDVSFEPKPVQKPHIPLLIGGTGRRPFRRVAEMGDGWFPMTATHDDLQRGVAEIRAGMLRLGRDPSSLWVGYTGFAVGTDPQVRQMRRHAGDTGTEPVARNPEESIREIERYRAVDVNFLSVGFAWQTPGDLLRELRHFARDVMPAFDVRL
jgi:probable F420-dependent oxidoreductase